MVIFSLALAVGSIQTFQAPVIRANHTDGHMQVWPSGGTGLLKKLIEGVEVEGGFERATPTLCSSEFPLSTAEAATRWRDTAGTGGGNVIDIFAYQSNCTGADVIVTTSLFSRCQPGSHACVDTDAVGDYSLDLPIYIRMNPDPNLFGPGLAHTDGGDHTTRDITHELGHALGHADYNGCGPGGQATLMDTSENCWYTTPQPLDEMNYHDAYHADAVAGFGANSVADNTVDFNWDGSDIHNERGYLINWRNNCTGQWEPLTAVDKNEDSMPVTGLQGGQQEFPILPLTFADPQHDPPYAGETRNLTVTVLASLPAPSGMAASFPSTTVNRFVWPAVSGADHYKIIRADVLPSGFFTTSCTGPITGTQYDDVLPTDHLTTVYRRVVACTAAHVCSAPSTAYTVSELFDSGAWDYVFTYYRSLEDINLQFINFNPNSKALQLHIRDGDTIVSPSVTDSSCIPANTVGTVGPMPASSFASFKLATQGHNLIDAVTCAATHGSTVGWGFIPPSTGPCEPNDCGELINDGSLAGVSDIVAGSVNTGAGLFYCITKTDHQAGDNQIRTFQQCNVDIEDGGVAPNPNVPPTWKETCDALADRNPPECVEGDRNTERRERVEAAGVRA